MTFRSLSHSPLKGKPFKFRLNSVGLFVSILQLKNNRESCYLKNLNKNKIMKKNQNNQMNAAFVQQMNDNHQQMSGTRQQMNDIQGCEHVQVEGMAFYDNRKYFMFSPDDPKPGQVSAFRSRCIMQQASDGTIDVTVKDFPRSQSRLIKKFAHGRVSETKDGGIQIFLKVFKSERINIALAMKKESREAVEAIEDFLLYGSC